MVVTFWVVTHFLFNPVEISGYNLFGLQPPGNQPEITPTWLKSTTLDQAGPKKARPAGFLDFFLFFKRIYNETDLNDDPHFFLSFGLRVLK